MDSRHVITIEGIGTVKTPHPTQEVIAKVHGSQCGFCTPGIVMSLYALTKDKMNPTQEEVDEAFDGNLCRCTGYRPILEGAMKSASDGDHHECEVGCAPAECAEKRSTGTCTAEKGSDIEDIVKRSKVSEDSVPFPSDLLERHTARQTAVAYSFRCDRAAWYHPTTVDQLLSILDLYPDAKLVHGSTEVSIEMKFKNAVYPVLVSVADIPALKSITETDDGVHFGGSVTLTTLQHTLESLCSRREPHQTRGLAALLDNLRFFAGNQIRNVACLAGNIVTASPTSDINPVLMAMNAILRVQSSENGIRQIPVREFFLGYRRTALRSSEVILSVYVPFSCPNQYVKAYKQSKRKDDDITIVNAGLNVGLEFASGQGWVVKEASFAFGGMGPTTMRFVTKSCTFWQSIVVDLRRYSSAKLTAEACVGKTWSKEMMENAAKQLVIDLPLTLSSPGGMIQYRRVLALSLFQKFILYVSHQLAKLTPGVPSVVEREVSGIENIPRPLSHGVQEYENEKGAVVGETTTHLSALKQCTGEAVYIDDMAPLQGELFGGLVLSSQAHAEIKSVDYSAALKLDGVKAYISANDIPGWTPDEHHNRNVVGPVFRDEEIFATKKVYHVGQMIGLIVAESASLATRAAKLVRVTYEPIQPLIVSIEDAIAAKSFFEFSRTIKTGAYKTTDGPKDERVVPLSAATHTVEGVARMSAQEHFYLETNCSLAVPSKEDDEMLVYASTQNPTETQHFVAHTLGIPSNRVVCKVKRMGGGFGGKESRSVLLSLAVAIAAKKLGRPVRCMLTREEDMAMTGQRHPFRGEYKVGFTDEGKFVFMELDLYSNGGFSMDLSHSVLERALCHADNCYHFPNVKMRARICKTNIPSNTAFRGFGGPQGMMVAEQIIHHVAAYLKKPAEEIMRLNFYECDQPTHFGQPMENVYLDRLFADTLRTSDFERRKAEVAEYNARHKYRKRGIAVLPTKFGLSFTARWLNQAGALVHVYTDGSVLITHGGTEMGQGLHTKMVQIAAHTLGVPISKVHLSETSTDKVPNTSATAASVSSDMNGMAILDACTQIRERLKPYADSHPKVSWEDLVEIAYKDRVNLSANGFYKTPDLGFDWSTGTGRMYNYFTYGAAVSEVEIDTLTGDHVVRRADIVMDIGKSLNPAIDVGQIEGAFTQGMGWCTIEEPLVSPTTGFLFTRGPGAYKIPGFRDIPTDLRVRFMKGATNPRAIHSSKAVGEPPLFLGASVFFAIKHAIDAARAENCQSGYFRMDSPATAERIRNACGGPLVEIAHVPNEMGKPWAVVA
ncbi:hypothetical protein HK097_011269 [Rhizophlyctis rosea]|uniref:xanthine dehydrogenase n=1 Tax=Rhizophlyctis rosea TaxID=64517 RepID=A0AAD5SJU8_9FUNG|nr:hypothetical protein HK097_011269 [Rhizophlyctis rosea]